MTQFNQIGETGLGELLTRRLTTPGGSNAPTVAPEIFPVLALENDRPEWSYLKGEALCACRGSVAAGGAGTLATVLAANPIGSGMIITIESLVATPASGLVNARLIPFVATGALATITTAFRDARWFKQSIGSAAIVPQRPVLQVTTDNAGGSSNQPIAVLLPSGVYVDFPMVLSPGTSLNIQQNTDAVAITTFGMIWRERRAQPGELA